MRAETTSERPSLVNISAKAGNVKCNDRILEDLNTTIRRSIMNEDCNEPLYRHKHGTLQAALMEQTNLWLRRKKRSLIQEFLVSSSIF